MISTLKENLQRYRMNLRLYTNKFIQKKKLKVLFVIFPVIKRANESE